MFDNSDTKRLPLKIMVSLSQHIYTTYTAPYHFGLKKDCFTIAPRTHSPRVLYVVCFIHICAKLILFY